MKTEDAETAEGERKKEMDFSSPFKLSSPFRLKTAPETQTY